MRPAALLAGVLLVAAAVAQTPPPGLTMHRTQAGEPDASGWMTAASTEGGFSVRLPLKFNDFTVEESNPQAAALRLFVVGTRSREGIKFTATRVVYRAGAESAQRYFRRFESGQGLAPERITPLVVGERRAVDLVLKRADAVAYQRVVLLGSDLLLMVVESPRAHEETARELATPFFESLVVTPR